MGAGLLSRIAGAVGTPAYVYDAAVIRECYTRFAAALAPVPHRIHYSVKANGTLAVLRVLRDLGAGADIVSAGELARALRAGFAPERIVFSGVGKRPDELDAAVEAGIALVNVESGAEVAHLAQAAARARRSVAVGVRVNPDVTADTHPYTRTAGRGIKFGVPVDQARAVAQTIHDAELLTLRSLGVHIGSQVADGAPYAAAAATLEQLAGVLRADGIGTLESIDLGGGLAVPYGGESRGLAPGEFARAVLPAVQRLKLTLLVEPGRALVAQAGTLLTRVLYRKHSGGREIVVTDAGMSELLRPSLYGAEHAIEVVDVASGDGTPEVVDVVGPLCESGDFLGLGRTLAGARPGALLAIRTAGAYGFCMSSNYNARPRPPEVLVDGDRWAVIRRREAVEDLMRSEETEPAWQA